MTWNKQVNIKDDWDWGFTAVDETELEPVQLKNEKQIQLEEENKRINDELTDCRERLNKMYRDIQPLLENLKANPEKEYIYWPSRKEKVESFSKHLYGIFQGTGE